MPTEILDARPLAYDGGGHAGQMARQGRRHRQGGDIMAEIETDKATMEFEAVDEGTIGKIVIAEGTEGVAVNAVNRRACWRTAKAQTDIGSAPAAAAAAAAPAAKAEAMRPQRAAVAAAPSAPAAAPAANRRNAHLCVNARWRGASRPTKGLDLRHDGRLRPAGPHREGGR